jgi:hypothetical protein
MGNLSKIINFDIADCSDTKKDHSFNQMITIKDTFIPVVILGLNPDAKSVVNSTGVSNWNKNLTITYNPCDKFPRWDLQ